MSIGAATSWAGLGLVVVGVIVFLVGVFSATETHRRELTESPTTGLGDIIKLFISVVKQMLTLLFGKDTPSQKRIMAAGVLLISIGVLVLIAGLVTLGVSGGSSNGDGAAPSASPSGASGSS